MNRKQRFPHKYVKREYRNGKWIYYYGDEKETFSQVTRGTDKHSVVIAHGKPTQIMVNPTTGDIVFGPPNIVGKQLYINTKQKPGGYFARAKDPSGKAPDTYLYTEDALKTAAAKKAAKFVKASRAMTLLNRHAESMMGSRNSVERDYGLAIWLNNNTQMRIGAHSDAASVDPKERAHIIKSAKKEGWGEQTKRMALDMARKPTFGLLSLRGGHVQFAAGGDPTVTFRFPGKGGKENTHVARLTPQTYRLLMEKKYLQGDDAKLFDKVNYKRIWRTYKKYGVTPHISRGVFAEALVKQLMEDFQVYDHESANQAVRRFNEDLTARVSNHLNHTRNMTERSYLTASTQQAVNDFRRSIHAKVGNFRESDSTSPEIGDALGEVILWQRLGVGNTVI